VRSIYAARRLRVRRPEDHHLAVLECILEQVVLLRDAQAARKAPHVVATPLPAFPAVGVVLDVGHAPQVDEAIVGAEPVADVAPEMVRRGRGHYRGRTVLALQPDHLLGHHVERGVPADGLVPGLATLVDVAIALGVEVDALERRQDALGGVDSGLVRYRPRRECRASRRGELAASRFDAPGRPVTVVELERNDTNDLAILYIHMHRTARG
jgi:hypothetical protein